MPVNPTYPGVYIEEVPSGVRTLTGVATSIAAFVGRAKRGPTDADDDSPALIHSFGEFDRIFGGLWEESAMGYAVNDFYVNGGTDAVIVRLANGAAAAEITLPVSSSGSGGSGGSSGGSGSGSGSSGGAGGSGGSGGSSGSGSNTGGSTLAAIMALKLVAANVGAWGNNLRASVDHDTKDAADSKLFNLTVSEIKSEDGKEKVVNAEKFLNLSTDPKSARYAPGVLKQSSSFVRVKKESTAWVVPDTRPAATTAEVAASGGTDGTALDANSFTGAGEKKGLYALDKADLFNLLCLPPYTAANDVDTNLITAAATYCENRRAILLVDPPSAWNDKAKAKAKVGDVGTNSKNSALFFPRLRQRNRLRENQMEEFVPSGAIAGVCARTDAQRGVWKAPAGLEATLNGVPELSVSLTDAECGELNPLGVNCLRSMPGAGRVVWGSRTLQGNDRLASEWKYLPVRRTALFIEESLYRGTQWVVFEPNDEPLWSQIRLNVGAFMKTLFNQGAFQGKTPSEAYFVKCDKETTTANDINLGRVNIMVGFAPLKPAEFVIIRIQQIARAEA